MEHQLTAEDVVGLLPGNLTLAVLDDGDTVTNIHEVGGVNGVLLDDRFLEHLLDLLGALRRGVLDAQLLAAGVCSLLRRVMLVLHYPVLSDAVTNIDLFALLGNELVLDLTLQTADVSQALFLLKIQPTLILFGGVVFLHRIEVYATLLAVELGIVLGAEAVIAAWHDVNLLCEKFVASHFLIIMLVSCFLSLVPVMIHLLAPSWSTSKSATSPNLETVPQRSITQPTLPG